MDASKTDTFRQEIGWPANWPAGRFVLWLLYLLAGCCLGVLEALGIGRDAEGALRAGAAATLAAPLVGYAAIRWSRWRPGERTLFVVAGLLLTVTLAVDIAFLERMVVGLLVGAVCLAFIVEPKRPVIQRLYLCRFPLLGASLLIVLPFAVIPRVPHVVGNLFVLDRFGIAWVVALTVLATWILATTTRTILRYTKDRFGLAPVGTGSVWRVRSPELRLWLLALPATPVIVYVVLASDEPSASIAAVAAVAGLLAARIVLAGGALVVALLSPPDSELAWPLPAGGIHLLESPSRANVPYCRQIRNALASSLQVSPQGYLDERGRLLPGHALAIGFFLATLAVYGVGWHFDPLDDDGLGAPALVYVLLLFILAAWLLPTLSFFFDRFRIPTVPLVLAVVCLFYVIGDLDHYFEVRGVEAAPHRVAPASRSSEEPSVPCPVQRAFEARERNFRGRHGDRPVVVAVAASGGGIAASAWTARILDELQDRFGDAFADSIHLVSSVSGGGVGAMYYLDAFFPHEADPYGSGTPSPPSDDLRRRVFDRASGSTLAATAWGLAYHDLRRALSFLHLGRGSVRDRAWAMEQVWRKRLGRGDRDPTLSDWRTEIDRGRLPIPVFNATVVETGERQLLSPIDLSKRHDPRHARYHSRFREARTHLYDDYDLPVVTAARLSATFPFVTPVARALLPDGRADGPHLADGGYVDNSGLMTATDWIHSAIELLRERRGKDRTPILIIQIQAFPGRARAEPMERAGWIRLAASPMTTMMKVRTASQAARTEREVDLLVELARRYGIPMTKVVVPLRTDLRAPLSWHLSTAERQAIQNAPLDEAIKEIGEFLDDHGWPGAAAGRI